MVHWKGSETCWWSGGEGVNYWVEASGSRTDVRNTKKNILPTFPARSTLTAEHRHVVCAQGRNSKSLFSCWTKVLRATPVWYFVMSILNYDMYYTPQAPNHFF
jgi:hypothetical protein